MSSINSKENEQFKHLLTGHVIECYITFLLCICYRMFNEPVNKKRHDRKFCQIKEEFYNFLVKHRSYFVLNKFKFFRSNKILLWEFNFSLNTIEQFIKQEEYMICFQKMLENMYDSFVDKHESFEMTYNKENISSKIKNALGKQLFNGKHIREFSETNLLVSNSDIKTKFLNYKDLADHIEERSKSYMNETITPDRIEEMSFKFQGSIENFEDQKSCNICMDDYIKDQEICQLPCNHFACRKCIEIWFKEKFQCPFCRNDCT